MAELLSLRLPVGIRDLTPDAASARRHVADSLVERFERWGYAQVITPAFEYESVLARGLGPVARSAAMRFVEPSSGQVLALRPDITPQVARLVATRFRSEPGPLRLCYEGPVFRHDAVQRSQREIIQAGVELAGLGGVAGESEVIKLAVAALASVGLEQLTIDLGHLGLAREVIDGLELPAPLLPRFRKCIRRRDGSGVAALLREARGSRAIVAFARLLPSLAGDARVIDQALRKAPSAGIRKALRGLAEIVAALEADGPALGARLHVDLSEIRGFDYYTGVRFQLFVHGAASAVGGGGRYDDLIGRYGEPRPAIGFAIDVEAAAMALEAQGVAGWKSRNGAGGTLVVGPAEEASREAARLREKGVRSAVIPSTGARGGTQSRDRARDYAARWGFTELAFVSATGRSKAKEAARPRSKTADQKANKTAVKPSSASSNRASR